MRKILLLLFITAFAAGCEKDDICSGTTPTTPRLVISFFDNETALPRNVKNLRVIGTGAEEGIVFNETATGDARFITNANTISIPLRTLATNTQYSLIYNSLDDDPTDIITDVIDFNYSTRDVYVSRACGFKTLFTLNADGGSAPPVLINNGDDANWIDNIEILESNIETENETHIKIFFN